MTPPDNTHIILVKEEPSSEMDITEEDEELFFDGEEEVAAEVREICEFSLPYYLQSPLIRWE